MTFFARILCFAIKRYSIKLTLTIKDLNMRLKLSAFTAALGAFVFNAAAWDYEGHHAVNELALDSLPADFPAFALTPETRVRIAYLAGEADRWRNETNLKNGTGLSLGHASAPDHYLDLEDIYLYDLTPDKLPPLRYDFVADIVKAREAHPERFPAIDPNRDSDHTRELSGFLPWAMTEYYEKLQSGFSTLAALEKFGGTPEEITNAKQNIVYVMGVMGHFVGDASQPLHTTKYFNGWVGDNPNHYTTEHIHAWIDGGFFRKTGGIDVKKLSAKIHPAEKIAAASDPNGIFRTSVDFVVANNQLVEPLYKLQKEGKLSGEGDASAEGRAFLETQIVKSGQLLGDLWLTAWQTAPEDTYQERELQQRAAAPATK
jgi:hypothetical protein